MAFTVHLLSQSLGPSQLLTLHSSPIQLLPAPGVGQAYMVLSLALDITVNSAAYANVSTNVDIYYGTDPSSGCRLGLQNLSSGGDRGLWEATANTHLQFPVTLSDPNNVNDIPLAEVENLGLYLTDTQNWSTGDGTVLINAFYTVIPVR